jgi:hypothetical protein
VCGYHNEAPLDLCGNSIDLSRRIFSNIFGIEEFGARFRNALWCLSASSTPSEVLLEDLLQTTGFTEAGAHAGRIATTTASNFIPYAIFLWIEDVEVARIC